MSKRALQSLTLGIAIGVMVGQGGYAFVYANAASARSNIISKGRRSDWSTHGRRG